MNDTGENRERTGILAAIGFPLLIVGILILVYAFRQEIWDIFSTPENVREWVAGYGIVAPLIFIAAQVLQVLVFIIPGETVQIAGGYLFGFPGGLALTTVGIAIGSAVNFYLARALGTPFVTRFFDHDQVLKLERIAASPRAQIGFFLLFVIPGIPKDVLCYVAGLSPMRFFYFLGVSMVGRLAGIIGSTLMGSAAAGHKWEIAVAILAVSLVLFTVGFIYRARIERWVARYAGSPEGSEGAEPAGRERSG
jgi:uncharacterized membrane protein YdjX (TVP38/TMEM64 family)